MNSKINESEILRKIFINYEKQIYEENQLKHKISHSFNFTESKKNESNDYSDDKTEFNLNIDINIKLENYNGNKKPINKMKQKLLKIIHCKRNSS